MKIGTFANELITGKRRIRSTTPPALTKEHLAQVDLVGVATQYMSQSDLLKVLQHLEKQRHNPAAVALAIAVCGHLAQQGVKIRKMAPSDYITQQLLPTLHETGDHAELIRTYIDDIQRTMRD
jgi:hypothetical protein